MEGLGSPEHPAAAPLKGELPPVDADVPDSEHAVPTLAELGYPEPALPSKFPGPLARAEPWPAASHAPRHHRRGEGGAAEAGRPHGAGGGSHAPPFAVARALTLISAHPLQQWVCAFEKPKTEPTALDPATTVLSPYLKFGALSPRTFYWRLQDIFSRVRRPGHAQRGSPSLTRVSAALQPQQAARLAAGPALLARVLLPERARRPQL